MDALALDDASQPEPAVSLVPRDPNAYRDANDCVEIHREPDVSPTAPYGWRYRSVETLRPPAAVRPLVAPGVSIRVADLLP